MLLALVVFLPLSDDWLGITRITLLRLAVALAFLLWLVRYLRVPTLKRSKFDLPILLFLVLAAFSALTSVHRPTSFLGERHRYQGLSTLLTYGMLYFLTVQTAGWPRTLRFLNTLVFVGALISAYGLLQYLGIDFVSWGIRWESNRSFSTLGNPVFLGGFLAMALPVALGSWLASEKLQQRVLFGACTLVILAALLTTFSRGAWIAASAGLLGSAILVRKRKELRRRFWVLGVAMICIVFILALSGMVFRTNSKALTLVERIASLRNIEKGSPATRILIWRSTLKLIRERPWLGSGPGTFRLVYPRVSTLQEARAEGYLKVTDNAHNYPLQVAATQGALGLWAFAAVAVLMLSMFKRISTNRNSRFPVIGGIWLGLLSYLIYLFSGIMTVETGALFWVALALFSSSLDPAERACVTNGERRKGSLVFKRVLEVTVGVLIGVVAIVSMSMFVADVYFARASRNLKKGLVGEAEYNLRVAMRLNPWSDLYPRYLGRMYANLVIGSNSRDLFQAGVAAYKAAEKRNPLAVDNYGFLGDLYLIGGQLFDPRYYKEAERQLRKAERLYPHWADVHSDLGILCFLTGRLLLAEKEFVRVLVIKPFDQKAFLYLAKIYRRTGRLQAAYKAYGEVLKRDRLNPEAKQGQEDIAKVAGAVTQGL